MTLGGTTTITQTTTLNANLGIDIEGITIGGGAEASSSTSTEQSKEVTYSIPPGRQAVYVSGTNHKSETGILQVNYADRQFDHFIVSVIFAGSPGCELGRVADAVALCSSGSPRRL